MMNENKRSFWRETWRLTKPYWTSEDKIWAWGLLIAVIVLNLGSVWLSVRFNLWNRDFFDAIQSFNGDAFKHQFVIFGILATAAIVVAVYQTYLQQMLQIRWRRWLTKHYLTTWLNRHAYYRLQLTDSGTDNPDQRIADDLDMFTRQTLSLTVGSSGFLSAGVTLVSFLSILWTLSGALVLPLGSLGNVTIPGYMVWVALVYAAGGTWLAVKIGRPLVKLNFDQQRYEADFRFSMMRLRENAESVALYGGEDREQSAFLGHFGRVFGNFRNIMKYMKRLNWYTSGYNQLAVVFPYLVAAPRYFSKQISFGVLQQTADAFGQVQQSLSFIVNSYDLIADWQSVVQRLASFDARAGQIATETPEQIRIERAGEGIAVTDLDLDLPNGSPLLRGAGFEVPNGAWLLITGPAGVGKSTLLRAIAGIWPYGRGSIRLGQGRILFLSQRPYIPLGNLRTAILYPNDKDEIQDERLIDALDKTGLGAFASERDAPDNWAQRLSLGEQQRLAFARILLNEPAFIFMDEATSSLDEAGEAALYTLLRQAAWKPTVVSVGHRRTLERYHDRILPL